MGAQVSGRPLLVAVKSVINRHRRTYAAAPGYHLPYKVILLFLIISGICGSK